METVLLAHFRVSPLLICHYGDIKVSRHLHYHVFENKPFLHLPLICSITNSDAIIPLALLSKH